MVPTSHDGQSDVLLRTIPAKQVSLHGQTTSFRPIDFGEDDVAHSQTRIAHISREIASSHTHGPGAHPTLQCPVAGCKESLGSGLRNHFREFHATKVGHTLSLGCRAGGCSKVFSRGYELQRHFKQCHETVVKYECTAHGSYKGTSRPSFPRADKLTNHIRTCHNIDTSFTCLGLKCSSDRFFSLEELGLHCRRNHTAYSNKSRWSNAIINATTWKRCRCPIWTCRQHVLLTGLQAHLAQHDVDEVYNEELYLREMGYLAISTTDASFTGNLASFTFRIQRPICPACSDSHEHFKHHLWSTHLFHDADTGLQHFLAWQKVLVHSTYKEQHKGIAASPPWKNVRPVIMSKIDHLSCDHCSFETTWRPYGGLITNHPSFMRPDEDIKKELVPYRMQILRLYPDFESDPIFDDYNMADEDFTGAQDDENSTETAR